MNYSSASNPKYASKDKSQITLSVDFGHPIGVHFFLATANDTEAHGKQLFADATAGKFGPIAPYVARAPRPTVTKKKKTYDPDLIDAIAEAVIAKQAAK